MMKKLITLCTCIVLTMNMALAQQVIRQENCTDDELARAADSIKLKLEADGFIQVKFSTMKMESGYEMPVIVPLTEGTWYHIVFIGTSSSRLYELRMYDWQEVQVVYEKQLSSDENGNIISFSYIPKASEYHMIKPVQINKKIKKDLCGYMILFKKVK